MEKVIDLFKANLSLALAIVASLLCYLCLCGPAFGYSTDESEFVYSFPGIIELLPSSFGAFIYIALILPGLGAVLLGLYALHRYFGFAGMAVLFADAIFTFFLSDFITAGAGLDYSFFPELWGSWLPALCLVAGCFALLPIDLLRPRPIQTESARSRIRGEQPARSGREKGNHRRAHRITGKSRTKKRQSDSIRNCCKQSMI